MPKRYFIYKTLIFTFLIFGLNSCKKYVEVPPPSDQLVNPLPFSNDATATSVIMGIYSEMMEGTQLFSSGFTTLFTGLCSDELSYYTPGYRDEFSTNQISQANHGNISAWFWKPAYKFIYAANLAIEQLNLSTKLTPSVKNTLLGEAKFIRAFCFFHLVNFFGKVPLAVTSNYSINKDLPRAEIDAVYTQIINDLKDAKNLLPPTYVSFERARPNSYAASALLAKVYLYHEDWVNAETEANSVITSGNYSLNSDFNQVFKKSSNETIWQLQPVSPGFNTMEGNAILPASASDTPKFILLDNLLNNFESNDQRKIAWVSSYIFNGQQINYPFKYKEYNSNAGITEYYVVLRLADIYLIRAEAKAKQNNIVEATADLNSIRNRAGLPNFVNSNQASVLQAIEQERRIELFSEWGNRWFDLKRTGRADAVLGILKPTTWQVTDILWPIPIDQIQLNSSLTQNAGY